ncbi:MAG: exodeoxyribonuclease 7 large subunit/superoxide dismutase [Pseudomonadota bacterium]
MPELPQRAVWGVASLLLATTDALAARFGAVAVCGELSGLARAASGHVYFSLKDTDGAPALLRCAMFRRAATLLDFAPADGQQVELRGRLGVYEARGELQLVVESMRRVGEGALYEEFLRRRARLAAEGLFDVARKRPLPPQPRALGVVTSLAAAALRDVITALQRRAPQVRVVIYPAPVQGAEAPAALVEALATAGRRAEVDALLLVRGGGSLEDLWAFNDERLVRAIAACPLPVVCGVGHETDVTLADLAAPPNWPRRRWPSCARSSTPGPTAHGARRSVRCSAWPSAPTRWPRAWARRRARWRRTARAWSRAPSAWRARRC